MKLITLTLLDKTKKMQYYAPEGIAELGNPVLFLAIYALDSEGNCRYIDYSVFTAHKYAPTTIMVEL